MPKPKICIALCLAFLFTSCASLFSSGIGVETVLERSRDIAFELDNEAAENDAAEGRELAAKRELAFVWPLREISVNSRFGRRDGRPHSGVDLHASMGTQVFAAADGVVVLASDDISGYGNTIIIRHRGNYATVYGHLYDYLVDKNDRVKQGQAIGYSGDSGRASGPHLHFEIREGMTAVDPMPVIVRKK